LLKSIGILEGITKDKIRGHRACEFSIGEKTSWAIDILKKNGLKYDSSVFPVKTHLYGVPDAPLYPYHISSSGGFYLRFFPYWFIKHAMKMINKMGQPTVIYVHPWEFDQKQPRIKELNWLHYYRLISTERKFKKLLKDFKFSLIQERISHA
jgi:hypothetical protein